MWSLSSKPSLSLVTSIVKCYWERAKLHCARVPMGVYGWRAGMFQWQVTIQWGVKAAARLLLYHPSPHFLHGSRKVKAMQRGDHERLASLSHTHTQLKHLSVVASEKKEKKKEEDPTSPPPPCHLVEWMNECMSEWSEWGDWLVGWLADCIDKHGEWWMYEKGWTKGALTLNDHSHGLA